MHGVKRQRETPQAIAARKQKELGEIKAYLHLNDALIERKARSDLSDEAFKLTTEILNTNPEFYTAWNYRRTILSDGMFPKIPPAEMVKVLQSELGFTFKLLRLHPKIYWIWNHRRWCLENVPEGPVVEEQVTLGWRIEGWDQELFVVEKMLERDPRNFHAWNYRRYALNSHPKSRDPKDELAYTQKKIENNFSNFSAWHQRTKVLGSIWPRGIPQDVQEQELTFVRSALWTDPGDQSAWIYHSWLIGESKSSILLKREIEMIEELLAEEPNSKGCLESLIRYSELLIPLTDDTSETAKVQERCISALELLSKLDPLRGQRYQEMRSRFPAEGKGK